MRPPLIRSGCSDYKDLRLQHFIENVLPKYDIVGLQEMFSYASSRQSHLISEAKKVGFEYCVIAPHRGFVLNGRIDGGLVILSRLPIAISNSIEFPRGYASDCLAAKGVLYAKVHLHSSSVYLHLFTTHLQSTPHQNGFWGDSYSKKRMDQIEISRKFIQQQLTLNGCPMDPVIFMGDFNVDGRVSKDDGSDSEEYKKLVQILNLQAFSSETLNELNEKVLLNFEDVLLTKYGEHPVTNGFPLTGRTEIVRNSLKIMNYEQKERSRPSLSLDQDKAERVAASLEIPHLAESLDFVFYCKGEGNSLEIDYKATKVNPFQMRNAPVNFVSDHFGVELVLTEIGSANDVPLDSKN
jgi:endonuclease/exonuclease/phosphatase family metal-dependent hydrolase